MHPVVVLIFIMIVGVVLWPAAKHYDLIATSQTADLLVVVALILGYLAYKKWWETRTGR